MHKCTKCNKVFKLKTDLKRHLNRKFPCDAKKLECVYCGKKYTTREDYVNIEKCKKNKTAKSRKRYTNDTLEPEEIQNINIGYDINDEIHFAFSYRK